MLIIGRLVAVYKSWHGVFENLPKTLRLTLGAKIDLLFLETLESLFIASYLPRQEKLPYLDKAQNKLDILKFFLQVSWEIKMLNNKKYILLSKHLNEVGKMLYGWSKTSRQSAAGENK